MDAHELKGWRDARGLTQKALADLLGVHLMTVVKWETGQRRVPGRMFTRALNDIDRELSSNGVAETLTYA